MSDQAKIVTGLGKAELHRILVRGYDLTEDLLGKITFSQMTCLMLLGRLPTAGETRMTYPNDHLGYAITWYGLALTCLGVFAAFARGRLRRVKP